MQPNNNPVDAPESVFDRSLPTAVAISAIESGLRGNHPIGDTLLVNIATLVRNRTGKDIDQITVVREAVDDAYRLALAVRDAGGPATTVRFFLNDYTPHIPERFRRTNTPRRLAALTNGVAAVNMLTDLAQRSSGTIVPPDRFQTARVLPYEALAGLVRSLPTRHRVVMLSHAPLDWHVCQYHPSFVLVESFKGTILERKDLADKAFGNDELPFLPELHALLGDKESFSSPLSRKQKQELYRLAGEERWKLQPTAEIRKSLIRHQLLMYDFIYPILKEISHGR